jgi:hypothetical protein
MIAKRGEAKQSGVKWLLTEDMKITKRCWHLLKSCSWFFCFDFNRTHHIPVFFVLFVT